LATFNVNKQNSILTACMPLMTQSSTFSLHCRFFFIEWIALQKLQKSGQRAIRSKSIISMKFVFINTWPRTSLNCYACSNHSGILVTPEPEYFCIITLFKFGYTSSRIGLNYYIFPNFTEILVSLVPKQVYISPILLKY
jgi:hypothetical protein